MKKILFTVTNELNYDQRMQRICTTLQENGYAVKLIGRQDGKSHPLSTQVFQQKRLRCFCSEGPLFYVEYNIRLFFYLLFQKTDAICAIDLDTILPVYFVSFLRKKKRIYDAHELFTEMKEIVTRPRIHRFWKKIESFAVPRFPKGYTVNLFIANELHTLHGVHYSVIRNLPLYGDLGKVLKYPDVKFLYQGAVNEGRGFETLIPAMQNVEAELHIYGKGNFVEQTNELIRKYRVGHKVKMMGTLTPSELKTITPQYYAGIMLVENNGLSLYHSLANKFFDFMMAEIPQVCVDFPEYHHINELYHFAYMIPDIEVPTLETSMSKLMNDRVLYDRLVESCRHARKNLNWNKESATLLEFYRNLFEK